MSAALQHYDEAMTAYGQTKWERCITKGGKFVEAILKCLHYFTTENTVKRIEVGKEIDSLKGLPKDRFDHSIRLLIPRACRLVYNVASDRGARHDVTDFDPNFMDANLVVSTISWMLAEFIRFFHPGTLDPGAAQAIVDSLSQRRQPFVEKVNGITFIHREGMSARQLILANLFIEDPRRVSRDELISTVTLHGHTRSNATVSLNNLKKKLHVYEDSEQRITLLAPGRRAAEEMLATDFVTQTP